MSTPKAKVRFADILKPLIFLCARAKILRAVFALPSKEDEGWMDSSERIPSLYERARLAEAPTALIPLALGIEGW